MNIQKALEIILKEGYEIKWCDRLIIGTYSQSSFSSATNEIEFEAQLKKILVKLTDELFDERIKNCEKIEILQAKNEKIDKRTDEIKKLFGRENE